jgi:hypothetical protein
MKPTVFKLQVQEDESDARIWHDVKGADGRLLTFDDESVARAKLAELYPVLFKMEHFGDSKRTRVIRIIVDDED